VLIIDKNNLIGENSLIGVYNPEEMTNKRELWEEVVISVNFPKFIRKKIAIL